MFNHLVNFLLLTIFSAQSQDLPTQLRQMAGQKRVVVLYAPNGQDAYFLQQQKWFNADQKNLLERDMVVLSCFETQLSPTEKKYLKEVLEIKSGNFGLWLVGKDGGVKFSSQRPTPPQNLFDLIDAMPMRRTEMQRKN